LRERRNLGVERAQVGVDEIVFVVGAKIGERLGDPGLFLGDEIAPDLAVRQRQLG
jgi:hypothetical protein